MTEALHATEDRSAIRRQMRRRRNSLTPLEQEIAGHHLGRLLQRQPFFHRSKRIALYIASDGEIDPSYVLEAGLRRNKQCLLPVLHPVRPGRLWFRRVNYGSHLEANRFGIPEPQAGRLTPGMGLDVVLLPLVAFDRYGGRLGMGAGFYDRSFAFKNQSRRQSPLLVGLAHSCQEADQLPVARWDIPLAAVVTEKDIICCDPTLKRNFLAQDLRIEK